LSSKGIGNWSSTTPYPETYIQGCVASGGYAYCFGERTNPCSDLCSDSPSYVYYAQLSYGGIGNWVRTTDLPTSVSANYVLVGSYLYYFDIPAYYTSISPDGISRWETTTNYPGSGYPARCISDGGYVYCIGGATSDGKYTNQAYYAKIGAINPNVLKLQNPPPFQNPTYLVNCNDVGGQAAVFAENGSWFSGAPCFDRNIDLAIVFNCGHAASTASGCTTRVVDPVNASYDYSITVWYPYINRTLADVNCRFVSEHESPSYAWCVSTSSNSFVASQPGF
jgi:hypothetical protein